MEEERGISLERLSPKGLVGLPWSFKRFEYDTPPHSRCPVSHAEVLVSFPRCAPEMVSRGPLLRATRIHRISPWRPGRGRMLYATRVRLLRGAFSHAAQSEATPSRDAFPTLRGDVVSEGFWENVFALATGIPTSPSRNDAQAS